MSMSGPEPMVVRQARSVWWRHGLVIAFYGVLTVIMTWPLVAHLDTAVLGPPGDNLEYVWKLWWFKEALWEQHVSPLFHPGIFYPYGYPLALGETTMLHTLLGLPLTVLLDEVMAYNVMLLASFVLSGYGTYLLLRQLGTRAVAATIGGIVFAYAPYRLAHLGAGHLPLMGTAWIPLSFLFLERLVRRPTWPDGLGLGLSYAFLALSSWYYAVMVGPFMLLYLLLRARPWRSLLWRRGLWGRLLLASFVAGLLIVPAAVPVLRLSARGEMDYGQSFKYIDRWSASPADFFLPSGMHSLWGAAVTRAYDQNIQEGQLYLSIVALLLAIVGLAGGKMQRWPSAFAILGLVSFVLALGTTLHVGSQTLYVSVPPRVDAWFSLAMRTLTSRWALNGLDYDSIRLPGAVVIPLPTLLLYLYLPFMRAMRVWARFGLLTVFAVAVLAAWGMHWLLERVERDGRGLITGGVVFAVVSLLLLDLAVLPYPYGYTEVRGQPVDWWLAQQPTGAVIHYPLAKTWYGWMLYPTRIHRQPAAYGYGTFAPDAYEAAQEVLREWPSEETLALLREWGVRYVLMGSRSYGAAWPEVREAVESLPGVEALGTHADRPLYHEGRLMRFVRPSPYVPVTELVNGSRRAFLEDIVHVYAIR